MMRGKVDIVTYMMTMLVMRREGVVRERKVVIDEKRIMRRHHNTPKLAREDAGNRRRWRRRGGWTGISRKLEARLVVLEMLHDPGHDVVSELAGGQCAAQWWVDRLSYRGWSLPPVQLLPLIPSLDCVSKDGIKTLVRGKQPCRPLPTQALASIVKTRKA